jgi:ABC-type molybdenum transport system ATPase subunit/photorepair protein PhrA
MAAPAHGGAVARLHAPHRHAHLPHHRQPLGHGPGQQLRPLGPGLSGHAPARVRGAVRFRGPLQGAAPGRLFAALWLAATAFLCSWIFSRRPFLSETPIFALDNVSFAYPSGREVLHDVSFAFAPGQKIGLYGTNGSGKTTLFHIIMGLLSPKAAVSSFMAEPLQGEKGFPGPAPRGGHGPPERRGPALQPHGP